MSALVPIDQEILSLKTQFESVCTDKSIVFEREAEFAIQILSGSDYLLTIANANRQSIRDAVTNVAAIGISLNPAKKQAYLVPRKGKICLDISYMGMVDMATQGGVVKWVQSNVVYEKDQFTLNGFDKPPTHQYSPFSTDRGSLVGVFSVAKTSDGEYLTHTMAIGAVFAIRDRSESVKAGKASPWKTDEIEMVKKTCIKQASKLWPKTERLQQAIHYLNTESDEGIDFAAERKEEKAALQEQKPAELPPYTDEEFALNFPKWQALIVKGKLKAADVFAKAKTRATLTAAQIKAIEDCNLVPQE